MLTLPVVDAGRKMEFEEIVRDYGVGVFRYLYSIVGQRELAEDLYQEVMLSAYVGFSSLKNTAKVKSWLCKIAINKCRDYWRKEISIKAFWEEKVHLYYQQEHHQPHAPEERFFHKYVKEILVKAIRELPERYQEPLFLYYFCGWSLAEISDQKRLPLSTVKTRMKRAKDQLRKKVILLS
ncbi:RNA polymerase sigma factor [Bacillus tuaregi]|uniref:RNA polymerase sigma factor n=1 Tax=Bacillus tuaregi TaxID=1816695 RepID=UPI0008F88A83|nr:RNA polymerase sigma factor [Bacillus tuaregi]